MLQLAALLILVLGLAHSILGERYILVRLFRRPDLPKVLGSTEFTVQTLRFAWHITTVAWFGFGALLLAASRGQLDSQSAMQIIGCAALASGALPLLFTRGKHLSWLVLFAIGGLALMASAD
ncbi:hypothetical protein GCM10011521_14890 [Arenimonas soli]|uniref:DUF3325 domain-containing protein n=1 Tax=Arenimonas soli TaxID=2269504 RepID=A0ABQ1HH79_9GAMM|nr:hypothetical protein [Arenimonas soli]GGA77600.1 hypothetical protein GCM10011521_14890 [Arenimonas soli]